MKIIFAGTPAFAAVALQALIDAGHQIVAVYTQPDRPSGRGQKVTASAVKLCAMAHDLPVFQPISLRATTEDGLAAQVHLNGLNADVMVVAAYGLILPQAVLDMPRDGCLNIHASLLPRWRGAAPIHRAILAGDRETGITIMQMAAGLDTGDMLHRVTCAIEPDDNSGTLHDRLAVLGGQAICHTLKALHKLQEKRTVQNEALANYASKLTKTEAQLNWQSDAALLDRMIRGYAPAPVAFFAMGESLVRVWSARLVTDDLLLTEYADTLIDRQLSHQAGTVLAINQQGVLVCCGDGQLLQLTMMQWPGGKVINGAQILQANKFYVGQVLGTASDN